MTEQANLQQLIAKCWADDAFKQRLIADPAGTLAAEGMAVPEGVTVRVVENTAQEVTVVLPPRPSDLPDEALMWAGGDFCLDAVTGAPISNCINPLPLLIRYLHCDPAM